MKIIDTPIGRVQIVGNGTAYATWRIGEARGRLISTPELSDAEIEAAGLTGQVEPASDDANRLCPAASVTTPKQALRYPKEQSNGSIMEA